VRNRRSGESKGREGGAVLGGVAGSPGAGRLAYGGLDSGRVERLAARVCS
jgi:hypothetical protein